MRGGDGGGGGPVVPRHHDNDDAASTFTLVDVLLFLTFENDKTER